MRFFKDDNDKVFTFGFGVDVDDGLTQITEAEAITLSEESPIIDTPKVYTSDEIKLLEATVKELKTWQETPVVATLFYIRNGHRDTGVITLTESVHKYRFLRLTFVEALSNEKFRPHIMMVTASDLIDNFNSNISWHSETQKDNSIHRGAYVASEVEVDPNQPDELRIYNRTNLYLQKVEGVL